MKKSLIMFFLSLCTTNVFAGFGGNIGAHDDRRYSDLSNPDYRGVARIDIGLKNRCTGTFVSKRLVLTNAHCAARCTGRQWCEVYFWNGSEYKKSRVKVAVYDRNFTLGKDSFNGKDWALLESNEENNFYKPVSPNTIPGNVLRGGFGILRIIKDDEIPFLKNAYINVRNAVEKQCDEKAKGNLNEKFSCINHSFENALKGKGITPLFEDKNNFKIQECKILGDLQGHPNMVSTNCDSAGGDSGASLLRNNQIVGLNNSGPQTLFDESRGANALKTENFYASVQKAIAGSNSTPVSNNNQNNTTGNTSNLSVHQHPASNNNGTSLSNINQNNINASANNSSGQQKPTSNDGATILNQPEPKDEVNQNFEESLWQELQNFDCD